jgi:two-component system, NtrC family, sensor kinase
MLKPLRLLILLLPINNITIAQGDSTSPYEIIQFKKELFQATDDTSRILKMGDLSYLYAYSNFDSSLVYGQRSLKLAKEINFAKGQANALCSIGNLYLRQGDYPRAIQYQLQALQLSEKHHFQREKAISLLELGYTYQNLSDYSRSIDFLKQARELFRELPSDRFKSIENEIAITNVYMATNKNDSALACMQEVYNDPKNLGMLPIILQVLGAVHINLRNYPAAKNCLRQAIEINVKNNDYYSTIWAYISMANLYQATKQRDSSIYYGKKGFSFSQKIKLQEGILGTSRILSREYESIDVGEALYYRKIYDATNDEMYGQNKVLALQKTLAEEQERQRLLDEKSTAYKNSIKLYAFSAGLLLLLLVAIFLLRNNKQKQKANKLLETALTNLKATQSQLIQSEKIAGIAHEIQNPLNFVNNFSEVNKELLIEMKEELANGNVDEVAIIANDVIANEEKINHHGKRADAIVKGMLQHSRSSSSVKELIDVNVLVDEYTRLCYHGLRSKDKSFNATIKTDFDSAIEKINVVPQDIGRVVLNLLTNAFYAVNEKALSVIETEEGLNKYKPTVSINTKILNGKVEINISDNGNGIPKKVLDKIFQPFFTTKPTGQGTGLGLSLSYDIVKVHGGELNVDTNEGEGTVFIIQLPVV